MKDKNKEINMKAVKLENVNEKETKNVKKPIDGSRNLYLKGEICDSNTSEIIQRIVEINIEDSTKRKNKIKYKEKPIRLYIQSYGGDCYDMFALVDIILNSKTPVYTICTGYAMSAAFIIFISGHKRYITPHATLMLHQHSHMVCGTYQQNKEDNNEQDWLYESIMKFVLERTKLTKKDLKIITEKKQDRYFHYNDSLELGIATDTLHEIN